MRKYYIQYLDADKILCNTKNTNRKYSSVDEFIDECQKYGTKWETFDNIELMLND